MKIYQKVTQEADGKLFGWYWMVDHSGNVESDFDVLNEYTVYPHDTQYVFVAEHLPTWYVLGTYSSTLDACEAVKEYVNKKTRTAQELAKKTEEFQKVVTKNSLDERYKGKVVEKKAKPAPKTLWYLENLQKKARERTEEAHARFEEWRMERNWKLGNAEYVTALLNH